MQKELYITDLDGTLLNHQARLKNRPREILNRLIASGINFTVATARSWSSAKPILKGLNLQHPVVCFNGVMLVNPLNDDILRINSFTDEKLKFIREALDKLGESVMIYAFVDNEHRVSWLKSAETKGIKYYKNERKGDKKLRPCDTLDELWSGEIYYFNILNPVNSLEILNEHFNSENGFSVNFQPDSYDKNYYWYEFFAENCNKGTAILEVKKLINADKIIAFGDNINDIPMQKVADEFYAVANAMDEVKAIATGIIGSNLEDGVPVFIDNLNTVERFYDFEEVNVNHLKFEQALQSALKSETTTIGTQNEKLIHATLKNYFAQNQDDHEIKIGAYYADIVGENGIFEIQTTAFQKLNKKLDDFLKASHVTIVYPFAMKIAFSIIDEKTGNILRESSFRKNARSANYGDFFKELYRIKGFLMNKNLTICVASLKVHEVRYERPARRGIKYTKIKTPVELIELDYFNNPTDYIKFIPKEILEKKEEFSRAEFIKACGRDGSLILEILNYLGLIQFSTKKGNAFYFKLNIF